MTEELEKYEQTIKRKHSFAWIPKYEEEFNTNLSKTLVMAISMKTFEKLEWNVVYQEDESIEAKRADRWNKWTEKITVSYNYGKVKVKSVSLNGNFWDLGCNSLRVKLFVYTFAEIEKGYDQAALTKLEKETERANNLDDYVVPTELLQPKKIKIPNFWIPAIGSTLAALLLGYIFAALSVEGVYFIFFNELFVAFALAFVFKYLVILGNFTDILKLKNIFILSIIVVYVSNQYFQYSIIANRLQDFSVSFFDFIRIRLEQGFQINSSNTGWIGYIVLWTLQFLITYWIGWATFVPRLVKFQIERVPPEVVNFAYYHFVKGKTEEQVRTELSNMGWKEKQNQDEVFESIEGLQGATILNK